VRAARLNAAAALAAAAVLAIGAARAEADPPYPVSYSFLGALAAQGQAPDSSPPGANDFSCRPSPEHPEPVVLVHGLLANQTVNHNVLSPLIANDGHCVFSLTYGTKPEVTTPIYQPGGLKKMDDSAAALGVFIDKVLAATGASKVNIVGHSEGSLMPNWYVKYLGGSAKVNRYVGLTTLWDGTQVGGFALVASLGEQLGLGPESYAAIDAFCESCGQFLHGSPFMDEMREGGVAHPDVTYTNIVTMLDQLVIPYTSGLMAPGPNVTNHVVQQHCPTDLSDHLTVAFDPVSAILILNALSPQAPRPVPCTVVLPGVGAPLFPAPDPLDSDGDGRPDFADVTRGGGTAGAAAATPGAQGVRTCGKRKAKKRKGKGKRRRGCAPKKKRKPGRR
jgi:triacylglycerol esterase/lipase EstA (alpha/beta hydrolase family)